MCIHRYQCVAHDRASGGYATQEGGFHTVSQTPVSTDHNILAGVTKKA